MPTSPQWLARLRLIGIAEFAGRVDALVEFAFVAPAHAAGVFRMVGGHYVVAGFVGEQHWRAVARSGRNATYALETTLDYMAKEVGSTG